MKTHAKRAFSVTNDTLQQFALSQANIEAAERELESILVTHGERALVGDLFDAILQSIPPRIESAPFAALAALQYASGLLRVTADAGRASL